MQHNARFSHCDEDFSTIMMSILPRLCDHQALFALLRLSSPKYGSSCRTRLTPIRHLQVDDTWWNKFSLDDLDSHYHDKYNSTCFPTGMDLKVLPHFYSLPYLPGNNITFTQTQARILNINMLYTDRNILNLLNRELLLWHSHQL
jgi:hypothetical protein